MTLTYADLQHFTGTENWYRYPLSPSLSYTDGVRHVARQGGAYWLIDAILSYQLESKVNREPFQVWTLRVLEDQKACLTMTDGNDTLIMRHDLEFTDFPLPEIQMYLTDKVLMLPSEY